MQRHPLVLSGGRIVNPQHTYADGERLKFLTPATAESFWSSHYARQSSSRSSKSDTLRFIPGLPA